MDGGIRPDRNIGSFMGIICKPSKSSAMEVKINRRMDCKAVERVISKRL